MRDLKRMPSSTTESVPSAPGHAPESSNAAPANGHSFAQTPVLGSPAPVQAMIGGHREGFGYNNAVEEKGGYQNANLDADGKTLDAGYQNEDLKADGSAKDGYNNGAWVKGNVPDGGYNNVEEKDGGYNNNPGYGVPIPVNSDEEKGGGYNNNPGYGVPIPVESKDDN